MGLEVDDYERGDPCFACQGVGETPKYVNVAFSGTIHDGNYVLTQGDACAWRYIIEDPLFIVDYESAPAASVLSGTDPDGLWFLKQGAICQTEFNVFGTDKWGNVWWGTHPGIDDMVGSGYLWSMDGTKYEPYYWGDNKWTFRLANKRVPSNILVSYQP